MFLPQGVTFGASVMCVMRLCMACRRLLNKYCGSVWPGLQQRCATESDEAKAGRKRKVQEFAHHFLLLLGFRQIQALLLF